MERRRVLAIAFATTLFAGCSSDRPSGPSIATPDPPSVTDAEFIQMESDARMEIDRLKEMAERGEAVDAMSRPGHVVWVDPGSDAIEDAIAEAGEGGVVILRPGLHSESSTVTVDRRVSIVGQSGAILEVDTSPWDGVNPIAPAIYILDANKTVIWGIHLRPHGPIGGTGILVEDSREVVLAYNTVVEHQYSVLLEQADRTVMLGNDITSTDAWMDGTIPDAYAVIICNAERSILSDNSVTGGLFGYWICDQRGVMLANQATGSFLGFIFCKVPQGFILPRGNVIGAEFSATRWVAKFNRSSDCLDANYIVIDGSNNNMLAYNQSTNPGTYDIELVGDSYRFGFLTPFSFENTVIVGNSDYIVKDCGEDNTVIGGIMVDTDVDVCF